MFKNKVMRKKLYNIKKNYLKFLGLYTQIISGEQLFLFYIIQRLKISFIRTIIVKPRNIDNRFKIRVKDSIDLGTLKATFIHKFHRASNEYLSRFVEDELVIFDFGSNIGSTLVDFSLSFPQSRIFGFEMDFENYSLALYNTKSRENITISNCAIWYKDETISYDNSIRADGFVAKSSDNNASILVNGKSVNTIIRESGVQFVHYMKIDIEGAERELFFSKDISWLGIVGAINLELHDFTTDEYELLWCILRENGFTVMKHHSHWSSIYAYR